MWYLEDQPTLLSWISMKAAMNLCSSTLLLILLSLNSAADAQIGVYGKLDAVHFSNNVNQTSEWFYGPGIGIYDSFVHIGPVSLGADLRGNYLFGSNDKYRSVLGGIRVAAKPPLLPFRPYAEGLVGVAGTRSNQTGSFSTATSVSFSSSFGTKFAYQILGGLDWTILPHLDLRLAEVGYGRVSPVSSGSLTLPSGSVSHNWLWFVVVVAVGKLESVFCFPTFP
jgi:opacity protein-like surface antigen